MAFKIAAKDQDDLTVLSALLQDSIVERADIAFLAGEKRFVMIASRFPVGRTSGRRAASRKQP